MKSGSDISQDSSIGRLFDETVHTIETHAVFRLDEAGLIASWNKGAEAMSGWKQTEALHKPLSLLLADKKKADQTILELLDVAVREGSHLIESRLRTKSGEVYPADLSGTAIHEHTQLAGYVILIQDTTQRKKEEGDQLDANTLLRQEIARRKTTEKALQESNSELNAFASAAGHDLQEPLRMVVSYLQLIKRRYAQSFDQDGLEFLEFAMDGATRMKQLIIDLVEYSRIETLGKPFKDTDANRVLSDVLTSLEVYIDETGAKITHDALPTVWSDEVQLNELLQNLISNAIKFGKQGAKKPLTVHVGVETTPKEYIFAVCDNGPGIDKKNFETIFLIFKQLGNKLQQEGSGIGLAICKKIVKRHKGRIWVDSVVGETTTFYFSIPRKKEDHE